MECQCTVETRMVIVAAICFFLAIIAYIHLSIKHRTLIEKVEEGLTRIKAQLILKQTEQNIKKAKLK